MPARLGEPAIQTNIQRNIRVHSLGRIVTFILFLSSFCYRWLKGNICWCNMYEMCVHCSLHSLDVVMHGMKRCLLVVEPMVDALGTLLSHQAQPNFSHGTTCFSNMWSLGVTVADGKVFL